MIRLTTALLALGVCMAIATTAIAMEPPGWCNCNPEAPACRVYCGSDPEWTPTYAAPTQQRNMYMYVPSHGHVHKKAPLKTGGY
jgi:hypothetical protein